jgi:predicted ATPase
LAQIVCRHDNSEGEQLPGLRERIPFVGRQDELATFLHCLDAAIDRQGRLILVAGEAGVGKTRLLAEFAQCAQTEGWRTLVGHAYDSEGLPPYLCFSEALNDYVRTAMVEDLRAQVDEAGPQVALLAPTIHRRLPGLTTIPSGAPDEQRYRLFESVSDFLLGIPERSEARGLVLLLDDLHWAEPSSILLLQHLARRLANASIVVVGTYRANEVSRGHPLTPLLAEQRQSGASRRLQLAPLRGEELARLVREVAGRVPSASVVEAIARQTEGNPFFVGEVVRDLLADGQDLTVGDVASAVARVPAGVREVIDRRLERLSAAANVLLRGERY